MRALILAGILVAGCTGLPISSAPTATRAATVAPQGKDAEFMKIDALRQSLQFDLHPTDRAAGNNEEARHFADDLAGQDAGLSSPVRVYVQLTAPLGQPSTGSTVTVVAIWVVLPPPALAEFRALDGSQGVKLQQLTFAAVARYQHASAYAVASDESLLPIAAAAKADGGSVGLYFYPP